MNMLEKIDLMIKRKGIRSKSELSKGSKIPYTTIVNLYEKGTDNVKRSTLLKLAIFFDCSLDYLANDDYEETRPSPQEMTPVSFGEGTVDVNEQECSLVGERLKKLRQEKGESLDEVYRHTQISRSLLSKYERDMVEPGLSAIKTLAIYYNVSVDELIGLDMRKMPKAAEDLYLSLSEEDRGNVVRYIRFLKTEATEKSEGQ